MELLPTIAQITAFLYLTLLATVITPNDNLQSKLIFKFLPYVCSLLLATALIQQFLPGGKV